MTTPDTPLDLAAIRADWQDWIDLRAAGITDSWHALRMVAALGERMVDALAAVTAERDEARSRALTYLANQGNLNLRLEQELATVTQQRDQLAQAFRAQQAENERVHGKVREQYDVIEHAKKQRDEAIGQLERDSIELRDKRTDLLNIRGALSPSGRARRVPMELGTEVAPVIEWLLNDRDEAIEQAKQAQAVIAAARAAAAYILEIQPQVRDAAQRGWFHPSTLRLIAAVDALATPAAAPKADEPGPVVWCNRCRELISPNRVAEHNASDAHRSREPKPLPVMPSRTKGCPGVPCDHPEACPLDAAPVPAGGEDGSGTADGNREEPA